MSGGFMAVQRVSCGIIGVLRSAFRLVSAGHMLLWGWNKGMEMYKCKLRTANGLPSTNTKTKLDLTKLIGNFHKLLITFAKLMDYFVMQIYQLKKKKKNLRTNVNQLHSTGLIEQIFVK